MHRTSTRTAIFFFFLFFGAAKLLCPVAMVTGQFPDTKVEEDDEDDDEAGARTEQTLMTGV